jgi:hypothetical protein
MKSDSWSAMLPDVLASHSQNGSSDMGFVSAPAGCLDNTGNSRKSTTASHDEGRVSPSTFAGTVCPSRQMPRFELLASAIVLIASLIAPPGAIAQTPPARVTQAPVGTMSELMIKIIYPASDAIFYVTTRTPANEAEWAVLQGQALMVAESANLLMMPAHMRDEDRWLADAKLMRDAGLAAFKAAKAKDVAALDQLNDAMYQSCVTCHQHYRRNYGRGR